VVTFDLSAHPLMLKIDKGDGKPLQSSVLNPTTSSVLPKNVAVGGAIRILNQLIYTVGYKKYLTVRRAADSERRGNPQQLASFFPQQPPTKKMEHRNLAIAWVTWKIVVLSWKIFPLFRIEN
jgi:hypothetical protein